jgi:hypothetical protein
MNLKRKEFIKKTMGLGLGSGSMLLLGGTRAMVKSASQKSGSQSKDRSQKFKEAWVTTLMKNLDGQFDEKTRARLMEACGRDCARRGSIKMAEACEGNIAKLVKSLAKILGDENCSIKDNVIHLGYDKCYCELVADGPERLSDTYCNCSKGWVLEMFETAARRPVKVEVLQTIKRGAASCRFLIRL